MRVHRRNVYVCHGSLPWDKILFKGLNYYHRVTITFVLASEAPEHFNLENVSSLTTLLYC